MSQSQEATVTEMSRRSLKDRILGHAHPKGKLVEVPEWDATVEVRSMSIAEKSKLLGTGDDDKTTSWLDMFPQVIIFTCHDPETGEPVFTVDDLDWLQAQPTSIIERLATEGWSESGLGEGATEEKKDDS